jgi:hypothetical protein
MSAVLDAMLAALGPQAQGVEVAFDLSVVETLDET